MADSSTGCSIIVAPGTPSKTWLTGETAMAVDLVRSPRQTWSLETAMAGSETSVTFPSPFHSFTLFTISALSPPSTTSPP
jgi:hypothetical protein